MRATLFSSLAIAGALLAGGPLLAQHSTAQDIDDGGRVFRNTCANCHGPDGNEVAGIDLGRGVFRRAKTDQDLIQIIRTGVAGTAMPASDMSVAQAEQVVAYLRSVASTKRSTSAAGNFDRGKALFDGKGACGACAPRLPPSPQVLQKKADKSTLREA